MSLWLPRSPHSLLARQYARPHQLALHPRLISSLHHQRTFLPLSPSTGLHPRFQSTQTKESSPAKQASSTTTINDPSTSSHVKPSPPTTESSGAPKEPVLSRAWKKVKHEAQHYWHGSKLLAKEVRISGRLQWKILHGESLTRRERRQVHLNLSTRADRLLIEFCPSNVLFS